MNSTPHAIAVAACRQRPLPMTPAPPSRAPAPIMVAPISLTGDKMSMPFAAAVLMAKSTAITPPTIPARAPAYSVSPHAHLPNNGDFAAHTSNCHDPSFGVRSNGRSDVRTRCVLSRAAADPSRGYCAGAPRRSTGALPSARAGSARRVRLRMAPRTFCPLPGALRIERRSKASGFPCRLRNENLSRSHAHLYGFIAALTPEQRH